MQLKNVTLIILFVFSVGFANAQCEIINGSFEEWIETEFILPDGMNGEASGDVMLPVGGTPFIRLLFISFAALFDPSYALLLETEAQELSGISQSTDATDGDFALKLQAGYGVEIADYYSVTSCSEIPEEFNFDVKHVGEANDTLTAFVIFDQGLNPVPETQEDFDSIPAFATTQIVFSADSEYETVSLPVIQNFEAVVDTFYFVFISVTSDDTYFLIDNVNFENDNSGCEVVAPTISLDAEDPTCICHGLDVTFELEYAEDPAFQYNELIINQDGIIESVDDFVRGTHNEFCSSSESLSIAVIAYEGDIENLFEGANISDLSGCYELSNVVPIQTTTFPEFSFNLFVDGELQDEEISICLLDAMIEVFSSSAVPEVDNVAIFLVNEDTGLVELRIDDIDDTTTLPDIEPGEYVLGVVGYDEAFNLEVGQGAQDITFDGCFSIPEETYEIIVLGEEDNCISDVENIYAGNLSIRPNYSTGIFEINNPNNESYQFVVRDITGKMVFAQNSNATQIDLTGFANGVYVVSFDIEGNIHQEKIVKL